MAASADNHTGEGRLQSQAAYRRWIANGLLLSVTVIWGTTFVVVKTILARVDPIVLIGMRFLVASLIMTLILARRIPQMDRTAIKAGVLIGLILFAGYVLQTIGLEYTTASKCGFITGLSVVLVPVFSAILLRKAPGIPSLIGVGFAALGLAFLSLNFSEATLLQTGDLLSLAGAVAFGFHIVVVAKFAPLYDVKTLVVTQLWIVTIAAFIMAAMQVFVFGRTLLLEPVSTDLVGIGFLGILATALPVLVQNIAQRFTSPTHVAIIFSTEPVFAGIFGWWVLGDVLTKIQIIGAALIIAGMFIAEMLTF
ncbi:MAG: DMT family transporter [Firmicutes bacterium]|nr:DMT family transporter [Bacillota bacterium]